MSTDILRVEGNERIDLDDWIFQADEAVQENHRQVGSSVFTSPQKERAFILGGFGITNVGNQVRVDRGRAILSHREGSQVFEGYVTTEGDANKIVDVSGFATGIYGIFIRFEYVDAEDFSRIFWNPSAQAGLGAEFAQTIPTRRRANWSMRIELASPGSEWLKIGEANIDTGNLVGSPVDQRPLYFEGKPPVGVLTTYESGWSLEGGGAFLDRDPDRSLNGVFDIQTFTRAMRQVVEDVKGRGLRRWWDKDIGGMNIGFTTDPIEDRIALGDVSAFWDNDGSIVTHQFDTGTGPDDLRFTRASDLWDFRLDGSVQWSLDSSGVRHLGGLDIGFLGIPLANTIRFANTGMRILGDPTGGFSSIGSFEFLTNSIKQMQVDSTGLVVGEGLIVGSTLTTPQDDTIKVDRGLVVGSLAIFAFDKNIHIGNADFRIDGFDVTRPFIQYDLNDRMQYDRDNDDFEWVIGNNEIAKLTNNGGGQFLVGDENPKLFGLDFNVGTTPALVFDGNNGNITFIRSSNIMRFNAGGDEMRFLGNAFGRLDVDGGVVASQDDQFGSDQLELTKRHGQNAIVARGRMQNNGTGAPTVIGDHWNVSGTHNQTSTGVYNVGLDQAVDEDCSVIITVGGGPETLVAAWAVATVNPGGLSIDVEIFNATGAGSPIAANFMFVVVGRPNGAVLT